MVERGANLLSLSYPADEAEREKRRWQSRWKGQGTHEQEREKETGRIGSIEVVIGSKCNV